jgi:DNA-binding MarR family transcriptional regulator
VPGEVVGRRVGAAARGEPVLGEAGEADLVLSAVSDLGPVAQAELGRSIQLDPKDLVGVLNDLQGAGLVLREPDPRDRRKNAVSLTGEGARLLARCERAAREANDALLSPLSEAEREQFMGLLIRISGTDG